MPQHKELSTHNPNKPKILIKTAATLFYFALPAFVLTYGSVYGREQAREYGEDEFPRAFNQFIKNAITISLAAVLDIIMNFAIIDFAANYSPDNPISLFEGSLMLTKLGLIGTALLSRRKR